MTGTGRRSCPSPGSITEEQGATIKGLVQAGGWQVDRKAVEETPRRTGVQLRAAVDSSGKKGEWHLRRIMEMRNLRGFSFEVALIGVRQHEVQNQKPHVNRQLR
jgi:hypothetical protein